MIKTFLWPWGLCSLEKFEGSREDNNFWFFLSTHIKCLLYPWHDTGAGEWIFGRCSTLSVSSINVFILYCWYLHSIWTQALTSEPWHFPLYQDSVIPNVTSIPESQLSKNAFQYLSTYSPCAINTKHVQSGLLKMHMPSSAHGYSAQLPGTEPVWSAGSSVSPVTLTVFREEIVLGLISANKLLISNLVI